MRPAIWKGAALLLAALFVTSCASAAGSGADLLTPIDDLSPRTSPADQPLRVIASSSIVADIAGQVGGDVVQVDALLAPGSDPHGLDLVPADLQRIDRADLVLVSGFGLENPILNAIGDSQLEVPIVSVSQGIRPLRLDPAAQDEEHGSGGEDPHVWLDPLNVARWAENIAAALGKLEPDRRDSYQDNAAEYIRELHELDRWIADTLELIPTADRLLVSDHASLGYFAARYDFRVLGAVIPSYSTQAEPAPKELAELTELIDEHQAAALFVDAGSNRAAVRGLSEDLGIPIVVLYEGSLSGPSGPAGTYLDMMRYNAVTIRDALASRPDG